MGLLLRRHHKKVEQEEVVEVEEVDYEELTVPKLKELADEREIEYDSNIKKDDLIKLLQ